jgi:hypothetical protein
MFVKNSRRPPIIDSKLPMIFMEILPYAAIFHMAFAIWFYSVPTLFPYLLD